MNSFYVWQILPFNRNTSNQSHDRFKNKFPTKNSSCKLKMTVALAWAWTVHFYQGGMGGGNGLLHAGDQDWALHQPLFCKQIIAPLPLFLAPHGSLPVYPWHDVCQTIVAKILLNLELHNVNELLHALGPKLGILQITPTIMSENDEANIIPCRQLLKTKEFQQTSGFDFT